MGQPGHETSIRDIEIVGVSFAFHVTTWVPCFGFHRLSTIAHI